MAQKISNLLLVTLVAFILLAIPTWWLSPWVKWEKVGLENRNLTNFPVIAFSDIKTGVKRLIQGKVEEGYKLILAQWVDRTMQTQFEKASSEQFPRRIQLIEAGKRIELAEIYFAYLPTSDVIIPVSTRTNIMKVRAENQLLIAPNTFTPAMLPILDQHIQNYTRLIQRFPNQNFYLYYIDRLRNSKFQPGIEYFPQADAGQMITYIEQNKPQNLNLGLMMITSYKNSQENFFKTDHHWNIHGAWSAYENIYAMLAKNYPGISPMHQPEGFATLPGVNFCGSYARIALYPCQPEKFDYVRVDLPAYTREIAGGDGGYGRKSEYFAGHFQTSEYANHYGLFYGGDYPLVHYTFNNGANRNLLLMGSSYTHPMEIYLASHYQNTYIVDLRHYKNFSLGQFVKEHQIKDILLLDSMELFTGPHWLIHP